MRHLTNYLVEKVGGQKVRTDLFFRQQKSAQWTLVDFGSGSAPRGVRSAGAPPGRRQGHDIWEVEERRGAMPWTICCWIALRGPAWPLTGIVTQILGACFLPAGYFCTSALL